MHLSAQQFRSHPAEGSCFRGYGCKLAGQRLHLLDLLAEAEVAPFVCGGSFDVKCVHRLDVSVHNAATVEVLRQT